MRGDLFDVCHFRWLRIIKKKYPKNCSFNSFLTLLASTWANLLHTIHFLFMKKQWSVQCFYVIKWSKQYFINEKKPYFQCNYNNGLDDFALISMQPAYIFNSVSSTIILTNSSYFIHFTIHTQEINLVHAFSELNQCCYNDDHKQLALQSSLLLCFPFHDYSNCFKRQKLNPLHLIRRQFLTTLT